jgi:hypothetical protein
MGTANTLTNNVTNLDATPPVALDKRLFNGILKEQVGTVEIAAADDANSVYRVGRVHSSWRISNIIRYNDAITSGTDYDVGLYDIAATSSGAVININCFADAVSLASASVTGTNDLYEAGSDVGVEDIEQKVWEMAGLTEDPGKWMDLCYTGVTPGSGAGTLSVKIQYVTGD